MGIIIALLTVLVVRPTLIRAWLVRPHSCCLRGSEVAIGSNSFAGQVSFSWGQGCKGLPGIIIDTNCCNGSVTAEEAKYAEGKALRTSNFSVAYLRIDFHRKPEQNRPAQEL